MIRILLLLMLFLSPGVFANEPSIILASNGNGDDYSLPVKTVLIMAGMSLIPFFLLVCTAFLRVVIVLSFVRHAVGIPTTPSNQVLIAIALFVTFFIMQPILDRVNTNAIQPYLAGEMTFKDALPKAEQPFREFMTAQVRDSSLETMVNLSKVDKSKLTIETIPFSILAPAYILSELQTAFEIGFYILLPFLLIDLLVASITMSLGMMMVSPIIISMPIKILVLNAVGGWTLIVETVSQTFR